MDVLISLFIGLIARILAICVVGGVAGLVAVGLSRAGNITAGVITWIIMIIGVLLIVVFLPGTNVSSEITPSSEQVDAVVLPSGELECSCGALNNITYRHCTRCGKELSPPTVRWQCSCGTLNNHAYKYCHECGTEYSKIDEH